MERKKSFPALQFHRRIRKNVKKVENTKSPEKFNDEIKNSYSV